MIVMVFEAWVRLRSGLCRFYVCLYTMIPKMPKAAYRFAISLTSI